VKQAGPIPLPRHTSTAGLARQLARHLSASDLIILEGPLGSGKTYFARALCRALGLPSGERVTSPTFALINEYETSPPVLHADLYRLSTPMEVEQLGLYARRTEGALLVVEWGLPYVDELGGDALVLSLSLAPRSARLHATGARAAAILRALEG
jgi:tRNA threonylcarbamoyladenosine biosynthesis protein TsaE